MSLDRSLVVRAGVVVASMLAAALYLEVASRAEEIPPRQALATFPMTIENWTGRREPDFNETMLKELGVDEYLLRTYWRPDAALGLYVGYYGSQRQGDTMHSPMNCLPGAGWLPTLVGRMTIPVRTSDNDSNVTPIEVNRVIISKGLDRQLVLYWYQSHRRVVASEYWGKIYTVLDSVRYNRTDAALVRVVAPIPDDVPVEAVEKGAVSFVQLLFPRLTPHLPT